MVDYDRPPKSIKTTRPDYPLHAFDQGIEGTVVLEILIDTRGEVSRVRILESIPALDEAAIECVRKWRFEPALKDGRAVPVAARAPITFRTDSRGDDSPKASFSGRVVEVSDGDTISVMRDARAVEVRLAGVDCPESDQAFGQEAQRFTSEQVLGKLVLVNQVGRERGDRLLARVLVGNNREVSLALLKAGLAWHAKNDSKKALAKAEAEARASRRGLWSEPDPVPPWEWRDGQR